MEAASSIPDPAAVSELGLFPSIGLALFAVLWFGFFFWMVRDVFLAHRRVPKELKGIREALERIANRLENLK